MLTADDLDVPYDFDSLAKAGSMLGSGAIIVVDDSTPILDVALKVAKFYRHESCGKCTPCREGTNWTVHMLERIDRGEATPMDLEIMASVQEHIIGNCLCVLGDAMAMPIGSMIAKFRDEFEAHIERRARWQTPAPRRRDRAVASVLMPRPEQNIITFTIDGREVQAPENAMLVDAAKHGDVEIPVFCYEPKLGQPVGACRMCLVEIEGIPKLQTGCSTPVKDGMVVHTQSERVKEAQRSVVEFLLINHPLDCPVCDKGGECPLQDITFGWGRGISRFVEPKRHFVKPLELSPTIAIDRERCILCYRCVRFSPGDLRRPPARAARARRALLRVDVRRPPLRGAVLRQHRRTVPRRRADLAALPLPRAPVGHRGRGLGLHAVPVAVQRHADRPRRARPARAGPRAPRGRRRLAVRPRPLRLSRAGRGAPRPTAPAGGGRRARHRAAAARRRRAAPRLLGARAGRRPPPACPARVRAPARWWAARATNEEGFLLARLMREGLGSPHIDSRRAGTLPLELHRALDDPRLQARVSDLEFAHAVLVLAADPIEDAPILDLRLRKGMRRHGMRLVQASAADLLTASAPAS